MSQTQITEREMDWYSVWRALTFCKTFVQVKLPHEPDSREICRLLDVALYMARLNTIAVTSEGVDASLVDSKQVIPAELLQAILENPQQTVETLEASESFPTFESVETE